MQGYGDGMILSAPVWFEVSEITCQHYTYRQEKHHHADLILRAHHWFNGDVPTSLATLRKLLPEYIKPDAALLADLMRHGWVADGDRMTHGLTNERREHCIRRIEKKRREAPARLLSHGERFRVLERCGFACVYCGRRPPHIVLHVDHVLPVSAGGTRDDSNLVASCVECNAGKSARPLGSA